MCFLTALQAKNPEVRGWQGQALSDVSRGESASCPIPEAPGVCQTSLSFLGLWTHPASLCLCFIRCSPCVSMSVALFSLLTRTPGIGLGSTLGTQYDLALNWWLFNWWLLQRPHFCIRLHLPIPELIFLWDTIQFQVWITLLKFCGFFPISTI